MELSHDTIRKLRGLIVFAVVVVVAGVNYRHLFHGAGILFQMLSPFLLGAAIAFVLNVPMRWIEKKIRPGRECRFRRGLSLTLAIALVAGILAVVMVVVIPEFFRTLVGLQSSVPAFLEEAGRKAEEWFVRYADVLELIAQFEIHWDELFQGIVNFLRTGAGSLISTTFVAARTIASMVTSFGIGFVFAIYILLQKENLGRQFTRLIQAYLPWEAAGRLLQIAKLAETTFSSFLTGQCVEAVILGTMFFVVLSVLRMPYALLIGVLIAFTALIPVFGAFIGCVIGAFLILMVSPLQALGFIAVFLVLQQLEGNLIYPHVVGNSVGLPSVWVLVAVTLGGSMLGVLGMLVFIPMASVVYAVLREEVNRRLEEKKIRDISDKEKVDRDEEKDT